MRVKIALVIIGVVMAITAISVFISLHFSKTNLETITKNELRLFAEMSAETARMELLARKDRARFLAAILSARARRGIDAAFERDFETMIRSGGMIAAALFNRNGLVYYREASPLGMVDEALLEQAFNGADLIGPPARFNPPAVGRQPDLLKEGDVLVWLITPVMPDSGVPAAGQAEEIFAAAIPANFLQELFGTETVWQSGNIFVLDSKGFTLSGNGAADPTYLAELVHQLQHNATEKNSPGIIRYTYDKTGYIGAYTNIPGSPDWLLAAIAPFNESPIHQAKIMLVIASIMFLILGSIVAFLLSNRIAKPYEQISAQNKKMEKLVEIAEAASNSKSAFLANMSHEIRTPMNAIIGMSDLMPTSNLTVLQKGYFEDIKKMSKSLLQIINDILDFSKIEAGRLDLISVHYNFWSLFDNICSMSKIIAVNKNINFEYEMSQNVPQILYGDEVRVRQVITNVINNAVKYTMHGCVNVTAAWSTDGRESGKGILLISVKDTGIGIREEDRAELFQAFHQLDARKNRSIVGTGLGLAITNELLRLMNGSIDFESVYGKGTTFNIRLPSGTGDKMQVEESDTALHFVSVKPGKSVQVLVVDDIMVNLSVAQGFLSKHNIRADLAGSGAEAVAMARKKRYDLIFMDHLMPDMDGLEATTLIRSSEGAIAKWNKTVPIVALSANAVSGAKESFLKAGMDDFISKPIESRTMNAILSKYLPLEKMEKVDAVASIPDDCEKSKQIDLPPINGVNYSAGFNRFGEKYTYLEIIQSFIHNTPPLLEKIEYFTPDSLNIAEYRTIVHGIKGSARTIGAELVGFKAEQLERAALSHDIEFINNNKDAFIASAKQLISDLAALPLDRQRVRVPKEKKDAPPKELLEKLREACLHYDARTIEKTVAELEQYEYETGSDFITSLGKAIDSFDFSNAATQIRAYQQNAH